MRLYVIIMLLLSISAAVYGVTIYDIQYTTIPGSGAAYFTFPSLFKDQVVSTEGVVTAKGFSEGRYIISDGSGAWKSIFVNDTSNNPQIGDRIAITGTVQEISGCTVISLITSYSVMSSGNALPIPTLVTTSELQWNNGEKFEAVLVKFEDVTVHTNPSGGVFQIMQNSNTSLISNGFFSSNYNWPGIIQGQGYEEIIGIAYYAQSQYNVNPRSLDDLIQQSNINQMSLQMENILDASKGSTVAVKVFVSKIEQDWNVNRYTFRVRYNPRILEYIGVDKSSTISNVEPSDSLYNMTDSVTVTINYDDSTAIYSSGSNDVLIKLKFKALSYGESDLRLSHGKINETVNIALYLHGKIKVPVTKKTAWLSIWNDNFNKKNIFNPWMNQKITIEFGTKHQESGADYRAIIRIYDVQGRLLATPVNGYIKYDPYYDSSTGLARRPWDGRDKNKNLLPIGVYYCHLEVINRLTGESFKAVQPIVVADKLK